MWLLGLGWKLRERYPGLRCRYSSVIVQLSSLCKATYTAVVEGKGHASQLVRASDLKYREGLWARG